jgi:transposase InsO family protein
MLPRQQKETMISFDVPPGPGLVWHSDFFEWQAKEYVFFVDAFSSWVEVYRAKSRRPADLISVTRLHFMRQGIPRQVHADQGSAYTAAEFREFCEKWHVHLTWGSPKHPQGNAIAEATVKKIKHLMKGARTEDDFVAAFLAMNQTPMAPGRPTPAQLHMGRNVRDELHAQVDQEAVDWDQIRQWKEAKKAAEKVKYNKSARELSELSVGQKV